MGTPLAEPSSAASLGVKVAGAVLSTPGHFTWHKHPFGKEAEGWGKSAFRLVLSFEMLMVK